MRPILRGGVSQERSAETAIAGSPAAVRGMSCMQLETSVTIQGPPAVPMSFWEHLIRDCECKI